MLIEQCILSVFPHSEGRDTKFNRASGFLTYFIIIQPAKSSFLQVKINSVRLQNTISGLNLSLQVYPEYRCSIGSRSTIPLKPEQFIYLLSEIEMKGLEFAFI